MKKKTFKASQLTTTSSTSPRYRPVSELQTLVDAFDVPTIATAFDNTKSAITRFLNGYRRAGVAGYVLTGPTSRKVEAFVEKCRQVSQS